MNMENFIVVGENIHCSRIVKRNGKYAKVRPDGSEAVAFTFKGEERWLPIPDDWASFSPAFSQDKVKHVALAIYQSRHGSDNDRKAGKDYLCNMAESQIEAGARFLDVNVDEYSADAAASVETMEYLAEFYSKRYETPLSIDSSNPDVLKAGLEKCRTDIRPPLVNSVSLERPDAAELVKHYSSEAIVNASGEEGMPQTVEDRMDNFGQVIEIMDTVGIPREKMHLDPLVLPVSTDPANGANFLETTRQAAAAFDGVHLNGGLSNVSFGMPRRKLLNLVFIWLCTEAGTDGGIIDPTVTPPSAVAELDPESEPFKLAKAVLTGEDMFGMEFISAHREGRL